jgi:hypothetical protein
MTNANDFAVLAFRLGRQIYASWQAIMTPNTLLSDTHI